MTIPISMEMPETSTEGVDATFQFQELPSPGMD